MSTSIINSIISSVLASISSVSGTTILIVTGFIGLLIAAKVGWDMVKGHIGGLTFHQQLTSANHQAKRFARRYRKMTGHGM